jgi:hypothetical protein
VEQLGSQLEEQADEPPLAPPVPLADDGFVDFVLAGTRAQGEFRCADCGYGAVIQRLLPVCPMCAGTIWEIRPASGPRFPR